MTNSAWNVEQLAAARALIASGEARRVRRAARVSLANVAHVIDADPSAVGRWERGDRVPRDSAARKYAWLIARLRAQQEGSDPSLADRAFLGEDATYPPPA